MRQVSLMTVMSYRNTDRDDHNTARPRGRFDPLDAHDARDGLLRYLDDLMTEMTANYALELCERAEIARPGISPAFSRDVTDPFPRFRICRTRKKIWRRSVPRD